MNKSLLTLTVIFLAFSATALGQETPAGFDLANYGVRIQPDKRVMVVLATIEAARTVDANGNPVKVINTPLSSAGDKFRDQLNSDLAALDEKLRQRITSFLVRHKQTRPKATDAEIVAPFISMAYTLSDVPDLADPVVMTDLPGKLLDVLDFAPLVRDFYRLSSFSGNLNEYVKNYNEAAESRLKPSAGEMVRDVLTYLKTRPQIYFNERIKTETQRSGSSRTTLTNTEVRTRERRFVIVPEMLAPTGVVNFVNVKDEYFVVVPPDVNISFSDVRRSYLQYVIDPIVLSFSREVTAISPSVKVMLDQRRKIDPSTSPDVYLAVSRSLVAAIDAKQVENERVQIATEQSRRKIDQMKTDAERKVVSGELETLKKEFSDETALRLSEDYEKGAVLVFYFAEQLRGIEESGVDITASMREMLLSFEPAKERNRLEQYAEARNRAIATREKRRAEGSYGPIIIENPVTNKLIEVQEIIAAKDYKLAEAELKKLLEANPGEPRIHFNIGRVSGLSAQSIEDEDEQQAKLLESKVAYENVLRIAETQQVDRALLSLTFLALGRLYEFAGDSSYAVAVYDRAIRLGPIAGGGYNEALSAKQRIMKEQ
ncbi:MAG: hypothetical protein KF685_05230 [Acidobacteria bacterium]|nr:hypothetical protein [Acidobacteriota bacterium]